MIITKDGTIKETFVSKEAHASSSDEQTIAASEKSKGIIEKWIVPIGCATFFPLVYIVGKAITSLF